jgi:zinc protease
VSLARVLMACCLLAAGAPPARAATAPVLEATLGNGLRVLVLEDHRSPVASVQLWYRVGSRHERPGATGLAHFLEHLMFKGTARHGRGVFSRLVEQSGGHDNAFTSADVTGYYVDVAPDRVELVLRLEADRMRGLLLAPREIEAERGVIMEERRSRTEDDPDGTLGEEVSALAFRVHPYGRPVIGWMEDLRRIGPRELRAFYDAYYVPNNALLVVAGAVRAPAVLAAARRHFGPVPRGVLPPPPRPEEPPQLGERRVSVVKKGAPLALVHLAYRVPPGRSPDGPALELLSTLLAQGRASRLHRRLVYEQQLAVEAGADYGYHALDPTLFWLYASARPEADPSALERALLAEVERLQAEPVPDEELARARNQAEAAFVWQQDSVHARAATLARFELLGSWRLADRFVPALRAVSAADLLRVARAYFTPARRNVGVLRPAPAVGDAGR